MNACIAWIAGAAVDWYENEPSSTQPWRGSGVNGRWPA